MNNKNNSPLKGKSCSSIFTDLCNNLSWVADGLFAIVLSVFCIEVLLISPFIITNVRSEQWRRMKQRKKTKKMKTERWTHAASLEKKRRDGEREENDRGQRYSTQARDDTRKSVCMHVCVNVCARCILINNLFLSREKTAECDLRFSSHQFLCYFKAAWI